MNIFENEKVREMFENEHFTSLELRPLFNHALPIQSRMFENISYVLRDGQITIIEKRNTNY